jgi:hypothetical protein
MGKLVYKVVLTIFRHGYGYFTIQNRILINRREGFEVNF